MEACKWMDHETEVCCNKQCPMYCDFCPVVEYPDVCKYDTREGA